ncbi:hypothetical protein [Streptomyces echinatus]|uniref:Integral membrane protein n=1 Tax=Streptomyces echinatus TaxID=67293 RepID=A0A7W9PNG7_9ACTN|nr:hypothetical protein [Streptomyces echinatus]MBB5924890.1 hypothetical protein [Streptomyces echinatus]
MSHGLRRITGLTIMIAGIALGAWVAFGSPQHWHGAQALGRMALGLGSLGMISASPRLIFPDASD